MRNEEEAAPGEGQMRDRLVGVGGRREGCASLWRGVLPDPPHGRRNPLPLRTRGRVRGKPEGLFIEAKARVLWADGLRLV